MAKQPTLTVQVNSQQFQQFAQSFTNLTKQMQTLNSQFKTINATINQSNKAMQAMNATMSAMGNSAKGLLGTLGKITKHFITWSTIIGGVTALLGMGGGLFGIERLASAILARRRLTLGLGGDYGRIQAAQIFGQGIMDSPTAALQNVAQGLHGDTSKMLPLLMSGVNPFGPNQLDPDEVLDKVMQKAADVMKQTPSAFQLTMAKAMGFTEILDVPTLLRLTTQEGRDQLKLKRELTEKYKEELRISPRAQRAWSEFAMQLQVAGAQIQSFLGESLADLAGPLKDLSDGFTHLIKVLLESQTMRDIIKALGDQLKIWAEQLKGVTEADIKKFFHDFQGVMELLKAAFKGFTIALEHVIPVLRWIARMFLDQGAGHRRFGERLHLPPQGNPIGDAILKGIRNFHPFGTGISPAFGGERTPGGKEFVPPNNNDNRLTPGSQQYNQQFTNPAPDMYNSPPPAPTSPPAPSTNFNSSSAINSYMGTIKPLTTPGTDPMDYGGFKGSLPLGLPNQLRVPFHKPPASWNPAVQSMGPGGNNNAYAMMFGGGTNNGVTGGSRRGPLDSDNWQSNRTASLTIRNVPGANVFMTAAGMQG